MSDTTVIDTTTATADELKQLKKDDLIAAYMEMKAKLEASKAKAKREPKPKTAEQLAKDAEREAFEAITPAAEGTLEHQAQQADRFNVVDAVSKLVRALPWNRVPQIAAELASEVAGIESKDASEVLAAALVRKARAKKSDASANAEPDPALTNA